MDDPQPPGFRPAREKSGSDDSFRKCLVLYRSLVDSVTAGIAIKDVSGRYRLVNSAFAEAVGRREEEIVGRGDADLFAGNDLDRLAADDAEILAGRKAPMRLLDVPGASPARRVRVDRKPLPDDSGAPAGVVLTLGEVADEGAGGQTNEFSGRVPPADSGPEFSESRKSGSREAGEDVRESRAHLLAVLESTEDIIASRDRSHRVVLFNAGFRDILRRAFGVEARPGLSDAELPPSPLRDCWSAALERALGGRPHRGEFSFRFPEGETRHYDLRLTPIRIGDRIIGTAEFTRDVTEAKRAEEIFRKSEEQFNSFMAHFPGFAFIKDAGGRYIWASRATGVHGEIPADGLIGREDDEVFSPEFAVAYSATDRRVRETGVGVQTVEAAPAEGRKRYQVISKFPIGTERPVPRIGGMAIDITELVETREQLQAALQEKETLLREVHHRVKNNLAVINSLLSLQRRRVADPVVRDALLESQSRISAMAMIHRNLYRGDRLGSVDLRGYAEGLGQALLESMSVTAGPVRLTVESRDVVLSLGQAVSCGLILNELVTNSLKYAFPGGRGGHIRIGARKTGDGVLEMTVADDGVGLPDGFDAADTLGIRIVRLLAERQLRGTWRVEGEGGARFVFQWPAEEPPGPNAGRPRRERGRT